MQRTHITQHQKQNGKTNKQTTTTKTKRIHNNSTGKSAELNRHFSLPHKKSQNMQMASIHMKRCLISLIIRDIQIKATIKCCLILIRMGLSKRLQKTRIRSYVEKESTVHCSWEYKLVQSLCKWY